VRHSNFPSTNTPSITSCPIMVQLFYWESRGKSCRKVLQHDGYPTKILLFPYEGWAHPASLTYWIIKTPWWSTKRCKVIEVIGTRKHSTKARMRDNGEGTMTITGRFDKGTDRVFRLTLNSNVSNTDFQMGYSLTGSLERSSKNCSKLQMTHFAMVKRKGYWCIYSTVLYSMRFVAYKTYSIIHWMTR